MRERMGEERPGLTHHFVILTRVEDENGEPQILAVKGYIQTGTYPDGRLGEVFVKLGKIGHTTAWIDQWATAVSIALQYGAPVEDLFRKFVGTNFEPAGRTRNPAIPKCTSLVDYTARFLLDKYGPKEPKEQPALPPVESN